MDPPRDRKGAQILMEMVNQLHSWIPEISLKAQGLRKLTSSKSPFQWTGDLDKEWKGIKEAISSAISLSPVDITLPLHLYTDATKLHGMGYILTQPRSSDIKDGNEHYCGGIHLLL